MIFKVVGIEESFMVFIICFDILFGVIYIVLVFELELVKKIMIFE